MILNVIVRTQAPQDLLLLIYIIKASTNEHTSSTGRHSTDAFTLLRRQTPGIPAREETGTLRLAVCLRSQSCQGAKEVTDLEIHQQLSNFLG